MPSDATVRDDWMAWEAAQQTNDPQLQIDYSRDLIRAQDRLIGDLRGAYERLARAAAQVTSAWDGLMSAAADLNLNGAEAIHSLADVLAEEADDD
jgi:hypothetical protein